VGPKRRMRIEKLERAPSQPLNWDRQYQARYAADHRLMDRGFHWRGGLLR